MGLTLSREMHPQQDVHSSTTSPVPSISHSISHSWKHQQQNHHVRQASVRSRAAIPMPDHNELDKRFAKVLVSKKYFYQFDCRYSSL